MKADTAERLAERAWRVSDELNEMARDIEANEPDVESVRLRQGIGRVMWAVYFEILKPAFEEHPSLEPQAEIGVGGGTKIPQGPSGTRSAASSARPAAPRSSSPPRRRRSDRRRLDKPSSDR